MIGTILQLYLSFVKIGFTSFGGLSMIPLIKEEMLSHAWMTMDEVTDIVAIAEMTPGPLGLNCATFAGIRAAGILGAAAANLGTLTPSLTLAFLASVFFERFRKSKVVDCALTGVRPAVIGMVGGVVFSLARTNFLVNGGGSLPFLPDWRSISIGIAALYLLTKKQLSIPKVIGVSACLGLLMHAAGIV